MSLRPVPNLDDLATHPEQVRDLPPEAARDLLARVIGLQTALLARALQPHAAVNGHGETPAEDRLLTVEEAARMLGLSKDHLYRASGKYPFTVRLGSRLRFSARGIERYIRQRQG